MIRLAVVVSHPIQYYAPWFRLLSRQPDLQLRVFHLWDFGVTNQLDRGFGAILRWDVPLLDGYDSCFVPNHARHPGTHHPFGLDNPGLNHFLRAWQPDAILLFGYTYLTHLRLILDPRLRRLPILFRGDSHQLVPQQGLRPALSRLLRRFLFRRFSAGLPVGRANEAWMQSSGLSPRQLFPACHAVDNARFQQAAPQAEADALAWRSQLGIPADTPVVLFAGKFEPKKRPLDLLEAFAALPSLDAVLVFVGAGPLESALRQRASQLPHGRVFVQGLQNQSAMPRVYALADLVVLPSFGPAETWGLCINEAMNLARPVIVSSHVGCGPDLVIPGHTGWVYPAGDVAALSRTLAVALSDRSRLRRMGRSARSHVDRFSYAAATKGLRRALDHVLSAA